MHGVHGVKEAFVDVGVLLAEFADQQLDFLPLALADLVLRERALFRQAAGALDEVQAVIRRPGQDVVLEDAVEGTDQGHAREVRAVQLGQHALQLRPVEHADQDGLHHVAHVVAQGDLVAAQLLRAAVEKAPPHPGAEIAGRAADRGRDLEDIRRKDRDRNLQQPRILLDFLPVFIAVARVHHEVHEFKGHLALFLQHPHQHRQQKGILSARHAHGDSVAGLDQLVLLQGGDEGPPEALAELFIDALFDRLVFPQLSCHIPLRIFFSPGCIFP